MFQMQGYVLKLSQLTIGTTTAKNCEEIFGDATKSSGDFTIDPDGDGAIEPFTVYCDTVKSKLFFYDFSGLIIKIFYSIHMQKKI